MITGIGSLPFTEIDLAIDLIFSTCREIPFWPQLPRRSPLENMYTPFLESTPCIVSDEKGGSLYMDTSKTEGIEEFYEEYGNNNLEYFKISPEVAPGLYRFLERLKEIEGDIVYIKGQLTGPFSMGMGLKDEEGKPVIYNPGYFDIIKKTLNMKAKWMVGQFKALFPDKEVILFFDEPFMVSFGSAYIPISREEVVSMLNESTDSIGAKIGVHCCGNTDWSVLFESNIGIVNYDAFNFIETPFYFKEKLVYFLKKGGILSPGIVPSTDDIFKVKIEDIKGFKKRFDDLMAEHGTGIPNHLNLITTSCGLGSLSIEGAKKAMEFLKEIR
ncbi:MAG: hypothetical protein N2745_11600 [Syntrophorhabdaceae bacterium]|nr:hypothetical protein [Syntrophorhabdaceae bacterium]